jgi:hypothetical protein
MILIKIWISRFLGEKTKEKNARSRFTQHQLVRAKASSGTIKVSKSMAYFALQLPL